MSPVRWTEQAVTDVQAIRRFIERDSPRYGRLVAERLVESTLRLDTFPASGRQIPDLDRPDVRELIVGEYRIVYRLHGDAAILLTVFRSSRLFPANLDGL